MGQQQGCIPPGRCSCGRGAMSPSQPDASGRVPSQRSFPGCMCVGSRCGGGLSSGIYREIRGPDWAGTRKEGTLISGRWAGSGLVWCGGEQRRFVFGFGFQPGCGRSGWVRVRMRLSGVRRATYKRAGNCPAAFTLIRSDESTPRQHSGRPPPRSGLSTADGCLPIERAENTDGARDGGVPFPKDSKPPRPRKKTVRAGGGGRYAGGGYVALQ